MKHVRDAHAVEQALGQLAVAGEVDEGIDPEGQDHFGTWQLREYLANQISGRVLVAVLIERED